MTYQRVVIEPGARAALAAHVAAEPRRETGGILVGRALDEETVCVTHVSPPGPRAIKLSHFFSRDTRFLQRWLERRCARSGGQYDYVGEWHVHHALDAPPSCVDRRALWRIARRANYPTANPVLIIVEDTSAARRVRAYGFVVVPAKGYDELSLVAASTEPATHPPGDSN